MKGATKAKPANSKTLKVNGQVFLIFFLTIIRRCICCVEGRPTVAFSRLRSAVEQIGCNAVLGGVSL
jgi:hypothetical protein